MRNPILLVLLIPLLGGCSGGGDGPPPGTTILAHSETAPVHHGGDAADDCAIWVHPDDPADSLIIGTDKQGGLLVWDLDGVERQWIDTGHRLNNVDLRTGFDYFGSFASGTIHDRIPLLVATDRGNAALRFYTIDPTTDLVEAIGSAAVGQSEPYGCCLYRSTRDGSLQAFVTFKNGRALQFRLADGGGGSITLSLLRSFDVGGQIEGCVADDELGVLYVGEENRAIWRYGAEADSGTARVAVATVGTDIAADIEGLTLYRGGGGTGYLIASSQGDDSYRVFDRQFAADAANPPRGAFHIGEGVTDRVSETDGLDVTNLPLGSAFPAGLLVVQDGSNSSPGTAGNQNFKLVDWRAVVAAWNPPLLIDTGFDDRIATRLVPSGGI